MLFQSISFEISLLSGFDLMHKLIPSAPSEIFKRTITFLFIISLYNIPICGMVGVMMLIRKQRLGLALLFLISAVSYVLYIIQVGDGL